MITDLCIRELARILDGRLQVGVMPPLGGELEPIGRIVADIRAVRRGDVFLALETGEHDLATRAEEAFAREALGVVVAKRTVEPWAGTFSLAVDDIRAALWQLASWARPRLPTQLVAVAGAVGKTLTRSMIERVLRDRFSVQAPSWDQPDVLGVPLAVVNLPADLGYGVFELHGDRKDEIRAISHLCSPQIGVINSHTNRHSTRHGDGSDRAALELLQSLPSDGWAVLNGDDPSLWELADHTQAQVLLVGRGSHCDVTAVEVQSRAGELSFVIEGTKFRVPIWGRHPLHAALAACGVGQIAGLELTEIAEQLRRFQPPARRGEVVRLDGITVIDDTYDCRAISMPAALEILRELDELGRRIVVCGELAETEDAFRLHRDMGQAIVTACGADWLVACGRYGRLMVDAAREAGMPNRRAVWCQRPEDAEQLLNGLIQSGDVVLVRGGRGMAMDQVVSRLVRARLATAA